MALPEKSSISSFESKFILSSYSTLKVIAGVAVISAAEDSERKKYDQNYIRYDNKFRDHHQKKSPF